MKKLIFPSIIIASTFTAQSLSQLSPCDCGSNSRDAPAGNADPVPNGVYVYNFLPSLTVSQQNAILQAFSTLETHSGLTFKEKTNEQHFVNFEYGNGDNSCFPVRYPATHPTTLVKITNFTQDTILHETLHSLGIQHEQKRSDSLQFNTINLDDTLPGRAIQWDPSPTAIGSTPYDYDSIMHYKWDALTAAPNLDICIPHSRYARWWRTGTTTNGLTNSDIWGIENFHSIEYTNTNYNLPPAPFELNSPSFGETITLPSHLFQWNNSTLADNFTLEIDDTPLFDTPIITSTSTTSNSNISLTGLTQGRAYYWRVTANNQTGQTQATPLPVHSFFYGPSLPQTIFVDSNSVSPTDGLNWNNSFQKLEHALSIAAC